MADVLAPRKEFIGGNVRINGTLKERQPGCRDFEKLTFFGPNLAQNNCIKKIEGDTLKLVFADEPAEAAI